MIIGTFLIPKVIEESVCRNCKDYEFSEIGDYFIHSSSLMPNIIFEEALIQQENINNSIFINNENHKLTFNENIECQNYLTTKYVGRAPLEFYGPKTKIGREFVLICKNGDPSYNTRVFGTEDAINGYNRNANENIMFPK